MEVELDDKTEGMLAILAAIVVLLTAMLDPMISMGISVVCLVALATYKLLHAHHAPEPGEKK